MRLCIKMGVAKREDSIKRVGMNNKTDIAML